MNLGELKFSSYDWAFPVYYFNSVCSIQDIIAFTSVYLLRQMAINE